MTASALAFHGTTFDIIDRNGQPWLRYLQIGDALGYKRPHLLNKVYQANAAEFTDSMTAVVKLPTAGGVQDVRIFSLRGAHLLGMFARTARAAEFRRWVLDVLDAQTQPTTITPAQQQHLKELVDLVVESGKQKSHAETWARLHRKFSVPRYTELPADQFDAACQYLLGKLDAPSIIAIIQKHLPAQRAHDAHRAAAEASKHIYSAVFDAVMNGDEHYARHRYLLKFAHDSQINPNLPIVVTMDDAAFIGTWDGITREVSKHGKWWSDTDLSAMIHACATQLASRNPGQRQPPALACG